jgi:HEAT repeat protein
MKGLTTLAGLIALSLSTLLAQVKIQDGLESQRFSGPDITPCPACICVAPTGEVFVGVDLNGSLGKGANKGRIVRLIDSDHDGKADSHTHFAKIDNPRGLIAIGKKLYVLHTVIPEKTDVLEGMHLSVLTDEDWDGVADGEPVRLVSNVSVTKHNQDRGADHTTNGLRLGIDGWIYIAVGDFGFVDAVGADGTKLTLLGGGILRVRPDGSEMEMYTTGLRNIYDVAIDPYMNVYTRGNTNDGGGWNIRFIHHVQSAHYGYPMLFKNFTDEILPALQDLGGGSGTGAYFMHEPGWPEPFNQAPMMCDWGRSQLIIHRVEPDGATFTQEPQEFIRMAQIADLDVDGSSRAYLAAWDGAGYTGNPGKGFVERVVPEGWTYQPFPDLSKLTAAKLVSMLGSESATARIYAQQELLARPGADVIAPLVHGFAKSSGTPLYGKVAAIFTLKQLGHDDATSHLLALANYPEVREFALRALTDRKTQLSSVPMEPFLEGLGDEDPRVQVAAAVGLGRLGDKNAAATLLSVAAPVSAPPAFGTEGPHATPNSPTVLPHVAIRSIVSLNAVDACVAELAGPNRAAARWALRYFHDPKAVDILMTTFTNADSSDHRHKILNTLLRLAHREASYDGSWWWGTRPDTRGPYYKPEKWEATPAIESFVRAHWDKSDQAERDVIAALVTKNRADFEGMIIELKKEEPRRRRPGGPGRDGPVDLAKVMAAEAGEVGKTSIEDVILAVSEMEGNARRGSRTFQRQGCATCHTLKKVEKPKGPFMGHIGSIMKRDQIAESILKPHASISQGFATVSLTTNDDTGYPANLIRRSWH